MNKHTAAGKIIFFLAGGVFLAAVFRLVLALIPYPELASYRSRSYGLAIRDRNGTALRVLPAADGVKREWVDREAVPPGVLRVFIRAEDRRFYLHPGVDPAAVLRSAVRNLRAGRIVSGASTITMQLARLIRVRRPGFGGKLGEAWDALRLEARLSKKDILELWFNGIPFGSNIEGLAAMTRARFGIPVERLDDAGAALLAVIPRRPSRYDPAADPVAAVSAAMALSRRCGLNLDEEALRAAAKNASGPDHAPFYAPHFTGRIAGMPEARGAARPGTKPGGKTKNAIPGEVYTSLDLPLQLFAEETLQTELRGLRDNRVTNGAVLAIENETGAVRVYAGSASWFDDRISGKIDGIQVRNQPGSCLKPFLYALALDSGFSPADILPDLPSVFGGSEAYIPSNFNRRFNGPVRLRLALASSLNIPAVYLLERLGVRNFEEYLAALGFDSLAASMGTHGTGLALGNAEVSLEELVRGFSAFPRGGSPAVLQWLEDAGTGNTAQSAAGRNPGSGIMSSYAAWMIADILSDRGSRFVGFGPAPALATTFPSMFKTGTANQFQHIWALGATRRFTVGVWMGNFSGETVVGRTGSSIPARIARDLLAALEQQPAAYRDGAPSLDSPTLVGPTSGGPHPGGPTPALVREAQICALSGMAAGLFCPGTVREWLPGGGGPGPCTWHAGGEVRFPPEYRAWLTERFRSGRISAGEGGGRIRQPLPGSVYYLDSGLPPDAQALRIETAAFEPGALVYADGFLQGALNPAGVFTLPLSRGRHTVIVEDEAGSTALVEFEVR
ncbi:MAG: transglycosylase domain-containing protein [Spirochaetaceae bacterium]|nr:transglycosylase domain-containing protein [Spirochaetaceae bacterium]